jgi:biotin carboxylase
MANPGPNTVIPSIQRGQAVITLPVSPASAGTGISTQTFTINGVAVGDYVDVNVTKSPGTGITIASAYVSAANTITVVYDNQSGSAAVPAADNYLVFIVRSYPVQYDFGVTAFNNTGIVAGTSP